MIDVSKLTILYKAEYIYLDARNSFWKYRKRKLEKYGYEQIKKTRNCVTLKLKSEE